MHGVCWKGLPHQKIIKVPCWKMSWNNQCLTSLQMRNGAKNRNEQWPKQLLSVLPNTPSSILLSTPHAVPRVWDWQCFLAHSHQKKRGSAPTDPARFVPKEEGHTWAARAPGSRGLGIFAFHALKCIPSSTRHKVVPLFTKASDTDEDIVEAWVFTARARCSITFQTDAARWESHKPLSLSSALLNI